MKPGYYIDAWNDIAIVYPDNSADILVDSSELGWHFYKINWVCSLPGCHRWKFIKRL